MKWILVNAKENYLHEFHLVENNTVKEVVRYNPSQQSIRIQSKDKHRVFFIERAGLWNNYAIFKNEYGLEIGRLIVDRWNSQGGVLKMEDKKYHYRIHKRDLSEMVIYENDIHHPLITCNLASAENNSNNISNKDEIQLEYACLLLGMIWYLEAPVIAPLRLSEKNAAAFA